MFLLYEFLYNSDSRKEPPLPTEDSDELPSEENDFEADKRKDSDGESLGEL